MSPGQEWQSATHDYEQLYRLDVLSLVDTSDSDQHIVYTEFKEQLQQSTQSWYQTGLPQKNSTLPCTKTRMEALPVYVTYFRDYNVILHSSRSMMTRQKSNLLKKLL